MVESENLRTNLRTNLPCISRVWLVHKSAWRRFMPNLRHVCYMPHTCHIMPSVGDVESVESVESLQNSHNCTMPYQNSSISSPARLWQLQSFHMTWWKSWRLSLSLPDILQSICLTLSEANQVRCCILTVTETEQASPRSLLLFGGLAVRVMLPCSCCTYTLRIFVQLAQKFAVTWHGASLGLLSVWHCLGLDSARAKSRRWSFPRSWSAFELPMIDIPFLGMRRCYPRCTARECTRHKRHKNAEFAAHLAYFLHLWRTGWPVHMPSPSGDIWWISDFDPQGLNFTPRSAAFSQFFEFCLSHRLCF